MRRAFLLSKAIHIRYNSRQVNHPRKVRAERRECQEYKKCENELAAREQKGRRETDVMRNCQNELPAHSASPPFAAHGVSLWAEDAYGEKSARTVTRSTQGDCLWRGGTGASPYAPLICHQAFRHKHSVMGRGNHRGLPSIGNPPATAPAADAAGVFVVVQCRRKVQTTQEVPQ